MQRRHANQPHRSRSGALLWRLLWAAMGLFFAGVLQSCGPSPGVPATAATIPASIHATTVLHSTIEAASPTSQPGVLAQLQALLDAGVADGRAEPNGEALRQTFMRVAQALNAHTQQGINTARIQLLLMQQQVVQGLGTNTMTPDFGQAVLEGINNVSREYNLRLPPIMAQPSNADNGNKNSGNGTDNSSKQQQK